MKSRRQELANTLTESLRRLEILKPIDHKSIAVDQENVRDGSYAVILSQFRVFVQVNEDHLALFEERLHFLICESDLLELDAGAAPACPKIYNNWTSLLAPSQKRLAEELWRHVGQWRLPGSPFGRFRIGHFGIYKFDGVTLVFDHLTEFGWFRGARIVANDYDVLVIPPGYARRFLGPYQGRRDRVRSPHSRCTGFCFHQADYAESDFRIYRLFLRPRFRKRRVGACTRTE